jgi:neutral ceramidase
MNETILKAGVARQIITPPPGIYLIGYGDRSKGNRGVHDDLTATALVLEDGSLQLALVACDLLCLNEFIVDRVRAAVGPETQAILCCSHTHSGPIAYADERSPRPNRVYIDDLVAKIARAVHQASQALHPVHLTLSQSQADISINRREHTLDGKVIIGENPTGVADRSVNVLSVFTTEGDRLATLVNYACHGTVLGPDNLLASADWIGAMRSRLETELGGLVLFLQGATGDLNPRMGWESEKAWELAQSQGERLAATAIEAVKHGQKPLISLPLSLSRREVALPFEARVTSPRPPTTYRKEILAMAELPPFLFPLTDFLLNRRYPWRSCLQPGTGDLAGFWCVPLRLNVLRLGELSLVTFGCETFTEIGLRVKAASSVPYTLFASVTDGCIGYLPTAAAHAEGGYEVDLAPFAYRFPGRLAVHSAEIAVQAAVSL